MHTQLVSFQRGVPPPGWGYSYIFQDSDSGTGYNFCKNRIHDKAAFTLHNKMLLSCNNLFNFRATFSLVNNKISTRSENSTDWKLAEELSSDYEMKYNCGV